MKTSRKIVVSVLLGILLVGIVSASLLTYFGQITGSVEVKAPVFYLDGNLGGSYYSLLINEKPESEEEIYWTDGETIKFKTDALGVDYFYETTFNLIFYAKANPSGNLVQMRVTKLNEDGSQGEEICISGTQNITAITNYRDYSLSCSSSDEIDLDEEQGFVLEIFGLSENETDQYWLSTGDDSREHGASRIEVIAI